MIFCIFAQNLKIMSENEKIIALIQQEVVPAIGCTEPIAVALCVAKATELLNDTPEHITVSLSANIIKNAMGVGIPGTGMIGLPIAIALGALVGKSEYQLEVLRDSNKKAVEEGKQYIAENRISILHEHTDEKLFIKVECEACGKKAMAVIAGSHTNFIHLEQNGKVLLDKPIAVGATASSNDIELSMHKIWDFATTSDIESLRFILKARDLNDAVSQESLKNCFGHQVGRTINNRNLKYDPFGDTILSHVMARTAAAADARMAGCPMAVMSNSGSGNQGIATTMPVVAFAEEIKATEEQMIRALILSNLTAIYIKQNLGRLSALCGCVVASTGSSCGITYLMGGTYEQATYAIQNMVATLTGMLCDGAKPSCALKLASGVSTAVMCAQLAMNNQSVTDVEGIVSKSVDESIKNMTIIGRDGMIETDKLVLDVMTHKTSQQK